jgi:hypothetical protein
VNAVVRADGHHRPLPGKRRPLEIRHDLHGRRR